MFFFVNFIFGYLPHTSKKSKKNFETIGMLEKTLE
jgi:hypothetical protein